MSVITQFGRLSVWGMLKSLVDQDLAIFINAGAPTDGTSGTAAGKAGKGSLLIDYTNGRLYVNSNTKASPTWTVTPGSALLTGTNVAVNADSNVIGSIPVLHRIPIPAGTTGDVDTVLTHKTRITNVWLVKTAAAGGGAGTIQVKNGSSAVTDAMSINVNDQIIVRAASIDDAQHEIAAGGTLKITRTRTASTSEACIVYVLGVRVNG